MNSVSAFSWLMLPFCTLLSVTICLLLIPLAFRFHWVDHPGIRKVHQHTTPLIGGIAVYLAIVISMFLFKSPIPETSWPRMVMAGALMVLIVGAIDDRWELSPMIRLLLQILACMFVLRFTGWYLEDFGPLFSTAVVELGWAALPITVFAVLGVINSFNLVDGMDGLAGSLFLLGALGSMAFAIPSGNLDMAWFLALAVMAVLGFLLLNARFRWNRSARVFLGDAGSLMLGFLLAWSLIRLGGGENRAFMPMTAVWLIAVPLLDTASLIWRRWREGRSAIHADQNHLHHLFLRAGFTVEATWGSIVGFASFLAGIGVLIEVTNLPNWLSFYTFMLIAFSYYFYLKHCWSAQKFLGRHFIHHDFEIDEFVTDLGRNARNEKLRG